MARNRRNTSRSSIWSWLSFIVFGFLIVLLGTSIWQRKSPAKVITAWLSSPPTEDPILRLSKKELQKMARDQAATLATVQEQLAECQESNRASKGVINTETASLNMRSAPSLTSDILIKIPNGSQVDILYYDDEELVLDGAIGSWCKVVYAGQEGWVWGNYLITN